MSPRHKRGKTDTPSTTHEAKALLFIAVIVIFLLLFLAYAYKAFYQGSALGDAFSQISKEHQAIQLGLALFSL